jgi:hypothetical protein
MGDRVQGRRRSTTVLEDIAEIGSRLVRGNSGMTGGASRAIGGRTKQIDDLVDDAVSGAHDRQHTDKANR